MIFRVLASIVCVYSFIVAVLMIRLAFKKLHGSENRISAAEIDRALSVFRNGKNSSPSKMADAASVLVGASYFSVHVQTNKGENYKDHVQQRCYKKSLTPSNLKYINSIEGNYE